MSRPKAYCPEYGYRYQIFTRNSRTWEHCDYAKTTAEKKYLIQEYRLAYGPGFEFCSALLPRKYWEVPPVKPTFWEALSGHCKAAGIEVNNHYSDLYVPVTPAISAILREYGKLTGETKLFIDQVTGKQCYDIPFAFEPYWEAKQKSVQATKEYKA